MDTITDDDPCIEDYETIDEWLNAREKYGQEMIKQSLREQTEKEIADNKGQEE